MHRLKIHQAFRETVHPAPSRHPSFSEHIAMTALSLRPRILWTTIKMRVVQRDYALAVTAKRNRDAAQEPLRIESGEHCRRVIRQGDKQHAQCSGA